MNKKTKISLKIIFILFYYLNFTISYKVNIINASLTIVLRAFVNKTRKIMSKATCERPV